MPPSSHAHTGGRYGKGFGFGSLGLRWILGHGPIGAGFFATGFPAAVGIRVVLGWRVLGLPVGTVGLLLVLSAGLLRSIARLLGLLGRRRWRLVDPGTGSEHEPVQQPQRTGSFDPLLGQHSRDPGGTDLDRVAPQAVADGALHHFDAGQRID